MEVSSGGGGVGGGGGGQSVGSIRIAIQDLFNVYLGVSESTYSVEHLKAIVVVGRKQGRKERSKGIHVFQGMKYFCCGVCSLPPNSCTKKLENSQLAGILI